MDTSWILGIWPKEEFVELNETIIETSCLDVPEKSEIRLTDEQASVLMLKLSKCQNATQFQELEPTKQEKYLRKLRQEGVSIRQLSRMTGISIGVIRKYG